MLSLGDITNIVADSFMDGNSDLAGMAIFLVAMLVIMAFTRTPWKSLLAGIPLAFIFAGMGVISGNMLVILIIVCILGLAMTARGVWSK